MDNSDQFCRGCGTGVQAPASGSGGPAPQLNLSPAVDGVKNYFISQKQNVPLWVSLGSSVLLFLMLFSRWIALDLPFVGKQGISLLGLFDTVQSLGRYLGDGSFFLYFISTLFAVLCLASAALLVYYIYLLFSKFDQSAKIGKWAFILCNSLSVAVIVAVLFLNIAVSAETDGYVDGLFKITAAPCFVLIISILARLMLIDKKIPIPGWQGFAQRPAQPVPFTPHPPVSPEPAPFYPQAPVYPQVPTPPAPPSPPPVIPVQPMVPDVPEVAVPESAAPETFVPEAAAPEAEIQPDIDLSDPEDEEKEWICAVCQAANDPQYAFCMKCGTKRQ